MVGDTILIKDISINGNDNLTNADQLSETLTDNTINALGIDASSRTIWINGQPYGNAYVNVKEGGTLEKPIGGEIFNDFEHNIASGEYSHAEGHVTSATNANAHAEGAGTTASGIASHSEGYYSTASGTVSHAEGYQTTATKTASHAEGQNTKAIGSVSHAEGYNTIASASYSHAEGSQSVASGQSSHAEGTQTQATNDSAHAEGNQTSAAGVCSHAEGLKTQTTNKGEHAEGLSNVSIQGKTVHTVGIGSAEDNVEDRKNAEEIHLDGKHYVYGIGGYDGTNSEDDDVKTVQTVVNESINQITISYLKLKELRDASQLVPGKEYRINDYTCTTTQTGTRSAGNVFDIIVTADSESTLNEEARAINHEFDAPNQDHFKDCNLNAWKLWYCLDNDTNRFAWADTTNGKGVIYRMIDEWNNDVPYDFKNIQFKRYILDANNAIATDVVKDGELNVVKAKLEVMSHRIHTNLWYYGSYVSDVYPAADGNTKYVPFGDVFYDGKGPGVLCPINEENFEWFYTFSDNSFNDVTLTIQGYVHNNVIKSNKQLLLIVDGEGRYSFEEQEGICLNDIIFIGNNCYYNSLGNDCYSNSFGNNCHYNSFGDNCHLNSFGNNCNSNSLGNDCYLNSFGNDCYSNTFRNDCWGNTFGNNCYGNTFGKNCSFNTFGNYCNFNTFGNDCSFNTFGKNCQNNTFGNSFQNNTFGNNCNYNTFGNDCYWNSFGNNCYRNTFENNCYSNSFGNSCYFIKFASDSSASTKYDYYQFNHFGDGCQYIVFKGTETASDTQQVQNYNFSQGLQGTDSAYLTIDGVRNRAYETYISRDTDGSIKESVIADKLDKMIEITYKELYDLREANGLIPGQQYRIIDYTCTTIQKHTRSAGHDFDIIVTADSKNKLNEEARAIQHTDADDDYFDKCNLSAWKIWYCLDNDKDRFAWALGDKSYLGINFYQDYTYFEYVGPWTIEETNYTLCKISDNAFLGSTNLTPAPNDTVYKILYNNGSYQITNEKGTIFDISNINGGKGVIYRMIDEFGNDVPYDFKNIQFYRNWDDTKRLWSITSSPNNTINTQFLPCYTFSERQDKSSTSDDRDNSLLASNMVYSNVIKKYIEYNKQTLNNNCFFGIYDYSNNFGDNCYNNSFGAICRSNTFGNYCYSNIFGDDCERNTIGDMCHDIVLKINCIDNSFGNYCNNIILNARTVISDGTKYFDYYKQNQFGHGCKYITLDTSGMNTVTIKNYNFTKGLEGSEGSIITVNCKPRSYETTVSKTSTAYNGAEIFAYCLADVVLSVAPSKADPIKYT